jgi:YidC/Oxa1 family membrane protein insertase
MNQLVRYVLWAVLSLGILIGWQTYIVNPRTPRKPVAARSAPDAGVPAAPAAKAVAPSTPPSALETESEAADEAPRAIEVSTSLWNARFSTRGGALQSFVLSGRKHERRDPKGVEQVNLAQVAPGQPFPLSTRLGPGFGPEAPYTLVSQEPGEIVFERTRDGLSVRKRFTWGEGYGLGLEVTASRAGTTDAGPLPFELLVTSSHAPTASGGGFFSFAQGGEVHQAICHLKGEGRSLEVLKYTESKAELVPAGIPTFAGVDERYFLAAVAPVDGLAEPTCALGAPKPTLLSASLKGTLDPAAGSAVTAKFDAYFGPKDVSALEAAGHELEASVDFGFFAVICRFLLFVLLGLEKALGNWGLAIVALTVLVKLATLPLTNKQMHSMEAMRRLGPKIEEIKAKYSGDQQRIGLEQMKLYKEHDVQPLGGCLPLLVQMPVWFALYATLQTSYALYNEPFIGGWINDLTARDPVYVLPILMTLTMVATQLLTPQTAQNDQMKTVMYVMPVMFGVMMLTLPAGLVLYIFTNNVLSIAHSLWFRRTHGEQKAGPA